MTQIPGSPTDQLESAGTSALWQGIPIRKGSISQRVSDQLDGGGMSLRPPIPKSVLVELANICNHTCVFCPIAKTTRASQHISKELLEKTLREALSLGVTEVGLYSSAEPFATKLLDYFVKFCKDLGYSYIYTTTNGSIPTKERLKRVIDGGLSSIKFSVNGGTREAYKAVHGQDHFRRVIDKIKFIDSYRKEKSLQIYLAASFVECPENEGTFSQLKDILDPYVDELMWFRAINPSGQMFGLPNGPFTAPCYYPFKELHITQEGYLRACCNDYQNYLAVEDLTEMSLRDAWYSPRLEKLRQGHLDNSLQGTLCHNCVNNRLDPVEPLNKDLATQVPLEFFRSATKGAKGRVGKRPAKDGP